MKRLMTHLFLAGIISLWLGSQVSVSFSQTIDFGNYHALLIANQNYIHWSKLETPYNDVERLKTILEKKYGFKVEVLRDASQDKIVDRLEWYRQNLKSNDNFLLYFAGHGTLRKDGGYWIGIDGNKQSRSKWLHYRTISELIDEDNDMKARHVLVIADSCYAGTILRADDDDIAKRGSEETDQNWFMRMSKTVSRKALTSGGTEPVIDKAAGTDHSIFARELIERLEYNERVLESTEIYRMIKKDVHARAKRIVGDDAQAPAYAPIPGTGDLGGDFLFVPQGIVVSIGSSRVEPVLGQGIRGDTDDDSTRVPGDEVPPSSDDLSTFGDSFSNLRIVDSPNNLKIDIEYTFLSKHGEIAKVAARPLKNGQYPNQYFSHSTDIIERGRGSLSFYVTFFPKDEVSTISTDQIEFVMWNDVHGSFFRVPFTHDKKWNAVSP
jgi:hypothetical protein